VAWADTKRRLTDSVIRAFEVAVTYTPKGGTAVEILTDFRRKFQRTLIDGDGLEMDDTRPRLLVSYSLIPDTLVTRPVKDDTFIVDGQRYRVVEIQDSGIGYWICWAAEM